MAAGGYKEFVAGEVLDEDDINDYLMQGVLVFAGTAARGSAITAPVEGQFSFLADSDSVEFFDGSQWVEFESGVQPAVVSGTTGSPTLGTAAPYVYYGFTGNGSIIFSKPGLIDVLLVAGGGGGADGSPGDATGGGGAGGILLQENLYVAAGTVTVNVGAGGAASSVNGTYGAQGGISYLTNVGGIAVGGGAGGADAGTTVGNTNGRAGGSGGGASSAGLVGLGITTQGNNGGLGTSVYGGGGGGGNGAVGGNAAPLASGAGGNGGAGVSTYSAYGLAVSLGQDITGVRWFAGGGGGGGRAVAGGTGGNGGGGNGAFDAGNATNGSANTGGGGGGTEEGTAGNGGSGCVIVRVTV